MNYRFRRFLENLFAFLFLGLPLIVFSIWWITNWPGTSDMIQVLAWLIVWFIAGSLIEVVWILILDIVGDII